MPVIVTTVGKALTPQLAKNFRFKRVVMDEATMITESEAFLASIDAE